MGNAKQHAGVYLGENLNVTGVQSIVLHYELREIVLHEFLKPKLTCPEIMVPMEKLLQVICLQEL